VPPGGRLTAGRAAPVWDGRAAVPALPGGDVHVWLLELDDPTGEERLLGLLAPAERARADAYRLERHGRRYAVGRARLRELLGAYLGEEPRSVRLVDGPNGKPELAVPVVPALRFNLTHSEGLALCAIAREDVGVDLELLDRARRPRWLAVAGRFFHEEERERLAGLAGEEGWAEFLRIWTLKEACLKAAGFGLLAEPRSFSVAGVLAGRTSTAEAAGRSWRCEELRPAARAIAALAVGS
jgi:4'-phosphopantetheinyl transferase